MHDLPPAERRSHRTERPEATPGTKQSVALYLPLAKDVLSFEGDSAQALLEECAAIVDERLHGFLGLPFERVYVGAEFCSLLLPGPAEVKKVAKLLDRLGLALTFLTPPLPQKEIPRLRRLVGLLESIGSIGGRPIEVTVSDFGSLRLIRREAPHLQPVLGRVLAKLHTDTQLSLDSDPAFADVLPLYQRNSLTVPGYRKFLRSMGVERVELDWPGQGLSMDLGAMDLCASLPLPLVYTTCGRRCLAALSARPLVHRGALVTECHRECRDVDLVVAAERSATRTDPAGFILRGNVALHRTPRLEGATLAEVARIGFDRIVVAPEGLW